MCSAQFLKLQNLEAYYTVGIPPTPLHRYENNRSYYISTKIFVPFYKVVCFAFFVAKFLILHGVLALLQQHVKKLWQYLD